MRGPPSQLARRAGAALAASRTAAAPRSIQRDPRHIFHCHLWLKHGPACPIYILSPKKKNSTGKPCSQPSSPTMHMSRGSRSLPRNEQQNPRQGSSPPGRASLCRACPCPRSQQGRNQRWGHPSSHQRGARQGQSAMLRPGSPRAHPGTARTALLSRTRPPPGAAASRLTRTCCFHSRWG